MDIFAALIPLLVEVGKFINEEKRTKYQDRVFKLQMQYREEMAKGSDRDDALIYSLRSELLLYCQLYSSELKGTTIENKQTGSNN